MARILIVDDDQSTRDALRKLFERDGHSVATAANGADGLDAYRNEPVDVVVSDLHMPGLDGLEATAALTREFPDAKVIAMSAMGKSHDYDFARAAEAMGAQRLIEKPFEMDQMRQAVADLLAGT